MAKSEAKEMQRLDKCVSHLTGLSRQMATKLIKDGAVSVDGELITKAMTKVSINSHIVIEGFTDDEESLAAGQEVTDLTESSFAGDIGDAGGSTRISDAFKKRVFLMNKPYGYVCSARDRNHSVVSTLWGRELHSSKLQAVGRLDVDTTGLLLFTDDGALNHALTSPKKQVSKLYLARLNRPVPPQAVKQFAHGIKHPEEEKRYQSAKLTILDPQSTLSTEKYLLRCRTSQIASGSDVSISTGTQEQAAASSAPAAASSAPAAASSAEPCYWAAVLLNEGRYHEVKRLFEVVGCEVEELVRVALGSLLLPEDLTLGSYVPLSDAEIEQASISRDFTEEEILELLERYQRNLAHSKVIYIDPVFATARFALGEKSEQSAEADAAVAEIAAAAVSAAAVSAASADEDPDFVDDDADFDELDEDGELRIY